MCDNKLMPKRPHPRLPLQRRVIDKMIFAVAFVQPLATLPQIIAIYSRHSAEDISISAWAIFIVFDLLWLWYGLAEKQKALIVSAVMFTLMEAFVLVGAFLYGGTW